MPFYDTQANLLLRTQRRISQVAGTGVQLYAEDKLVDMMQHKFDELFLRDWWDQFLHWYTITLTGVDGLGDQSFTNVVQSFEDIKVVYKDGSDKSIPLLPPTNFNPFNLTGDVTLYIEALEDNAEKVFRVWPGEATGVLRVRARVYPTRIDALDGSDTVRFDGEALVLGTAWDYVEDDGTNPGAAEKLQGMFESRVTALREAKDNKGFSLDPNTSDIPSEWYY